MATHRIPILGNETPDTGVFLDRVSNQITAAAAPSVGTQVVWVVPTNASDIGLYGSFSIPENYVGSPVLVVRGILDGAPGASDTLGFGVRKRAAADNEPADGTFDAEQAASVTIGSGGAGYADEDEFQVTITLTAADYATRDTVYYWVYRDASGTTYTGNVLLTGLYFQYSDV